MKLVKFLPVTALATGVVLGTFVDSADAQFITREGNGYSERGGNEEDVFNTFILYDQQPDGQPISDDDGDLNNNRGLFIGAVEEFNTYAGGFNNGFDEVDFDNLPMPDATATIANLEVRWFRNGEINNELGLNATYTGNIIEYTISGQGNSINEPNELRLYLLDTDVISVPPSFSLPNGFTPQQATNDLSYILNNDLINKALPFDTRDQEDLDDFGLEFIDKQLTSGKQINSDDFRGGPFFEGKIESTSVPESNSVASLLALGVVGISFGLKQKMK